MLPDATQHTTAITITTNFKTNKQKTPLRVKPPLKTSHRSIRRRAFGLDCITHYCNVIFLLPLHVCPQYEELFAIFIFFPSILTSKVSVISFCLLVSFPLCDVTVTMMVFICCVRHICVCVCVCVATSTLMMCLCVCTVSSSTGSLCHKVRFLCVCVTSEAGVLLSQYRVQ